MIPRVKKIKTDNFEWLSRKFKKKSNVGSKGVTDDPIKDFLHKVGFHIADYIYPKGIQKSEKMWPINPKP